MTGLKVTIAAIAAIIMLNLPAFAQVQEYDTPYQSKWEQPTVETVEKCTVLGVFPCHDGFTYDEPESNDTPTVSRTVPQPEPQRCD